LSNAKEGNEFGIMHGESGEFVGGIAGREESNI
jgi:hypothetical protein